MFAGIPLALAKVQKATPAIFITQLVHEFGGKAALCRAQRIGIPLGRVAIAHRDKGGLAAHGQAHVACHQLGVNGGAQRHDGGPLFFGVGFGDAG